MSSAWLGLREAADGRARAADLVELLRPGWPGGENPVIHDLGCGTGSMGRWLAPQLPGAQHWVMHDRDADLLEHAAARMVHASADGAPVTVATRRDDVTRLSPDDLRGASLVTASALLDLLTGEEIERIAAACVGAGCPALLTLSVTGRVVLTPADPLDTEIGAAFDAHQRRRIGHRRLLGPDAIEAAVAAFDRYGATTVVRPSPWRLGAGDATLLAEWFAGWLAAACEQRPELTGAAAAYARRREAEIAERRVEAIVHHADLLARRG